MPYVTNAERFGMQKEAVSLVLRQLNRRIGSVPSVAEPQIRELPVDQLEDLAEALLDFSSEQDLLAWLNRIQK